MRPAPSILFVAVALAAACSDPPRRPPVERGGSGTSGIGGGSSSALDGGAPDAGGDPGDAGACTDLEDAGAVIDENATNDDLPAGMGGAVEDGIYELVDARRYVGAGGTPGPTGSSFKGVLRITGAAFERVLRRERAGGAVIETRVSGTFTQSGTSGTIALTCPFPAQEQVTYTASGATLVLSDLGTLESFTFGRN